MKLSMNQFKILEILRMYPNEMIMSNGWLTGGHGIKFDKRSYESLMKRKIIINGKLNEAINASIEQSLKLI